GNPTNTKWSLDGVDITDLAATGASPYYYDFDAFDEMTINTGGVDVTQQTGGVGINLVTKSGGDKFRGSGRLYDTNHRVESNNITDAQRNQGASSGNTNLKAEIQLFKGNKLSAFNNFSKKVRNARGADDLHPIETTTPQGAVPATYGIGKGFWTIGPSPTYKVGDQWVISDRTLLDIQ